MRGKKRELSTIANTFQINLLFILFPGTHSNASHPELISTCKFHCKYRLLDLKASALVTPEDCKVPQVTISLLNSELFMQKRLNEGEEKEQIFSANTLISLGLFFFFFWILDTTENSHLVKEIKKSSSNVCFLGGIFSHSAQPRSL